MGAGGDDRPDGLISAINVTPLVDVVLVLLIIFMATAPLISRRSLPVSVPQAATGTRATEALRVTFDRDRNLYLEKSAMDLATLTQELKTRQRLEPDLRITLAADGGLPYQAVVDVLDRVRSAGVKRVALEVAPAAEKTKKEGNPRRRPRVRTGGSTGRG